MSDAPQRFPLAWPAGRPRARSRKPGNFSFKGPESGNGWRPKKDITIALAIERLEQELDRMGAKNVLMSSNLELRMDGRIRADRGEPGDPGVCVYFTLKGNPIALACDAYSRVAQNIAALAAHLDATRAIERHGVATAAETLQAFQALPAPDHVLPGRKPWRDVLGFAENWPESAGHSKTMAVEFIRRRYKAKMIEAPNEAAQSDLNVARDLALKEFQ